MQRLGIEYDFLPRESRDPSRFISGTLRGTLMIEKGVLYQETEGKNKGCWVMKRRAGTTEEIAIEEGRASPTTRPR